MLADKVGEQSPRLKLSCEQIEVLEPESWVVSYIDLLLLMVTLFVLLLGYQQAENKKAVSHEAAKNLAHNKQASVQKGSLQQIYLNDLKGRVSVVKEKNLVKLAINERILFLPADATLSRSGEEVLKELSLMLKAKPWRIMVEGHTDNQAISTPRYLSNWELSSARASSVTRYLITQGVSPLRLSAIGYADTRPISSNSSEQGRAKNRRVALLLRPAE